ncbi:nucleotide-binding domain-containing protein [Penicillium herquei]|nr:nucleotide-binding domain-containing protein [Penicillium herquei]
MTIASQLPKDADVTILGEFLPGDPMDQRYVSQWAGAIWLGVHDSTPREQEMQLNSFSELWRIAERHPESGVRQIEMTEVMEIGDPAKVWYQGKVPGFRFLTPFELPPGAKWGTKFQTVVITPPIFLPWYRKRLEQRGVRFKRTYVKALRDLKGLGHDVLINATAFGSRNLLDVEEKRIVSMRQQNIRIRKEGYNRLYIRRGVDGYYSTAFARGDGTIYIGGIKNLGSHDFEPNLEHRSLIMRRQHENQPEVFPSPDIKDYEFITDHVGVYPFIESQNGGVRVEKEILHASVSPSRFQVMCMTF